MSEITNKRVGETLLTPEQATTRAERIKELIQETRTGITPVALIELEEFLNKTWAKIYDVYFVITGNHFLEQLTREEHTKNPISLHELKRVFSEFTRKFGWYLGSMSEAHDHYGVIRESFSKINVGFVLRPGVGFSECGRDIMLQTILRKRDFFTRNRIYEV